MYKFTVAPMLDWTDRHCRYLHRLISQNTRLYTEMVTTGAILHGDKTKLLGFSEEEHSIALQLGGSDPTDLAKSIEVASQFGYDEYNLNCGCPSERVQKGSFGACLMLEPKLVAECFKAMQSATDKPVTIKHRIGVDDFNSYDFVRDFVGTVYEAGCRTFIVHTRAAWLKGLSPKENREIPPLNRDFAFQLKKDFPDATICANGQIDSLALAKELIEAGLDGVMVGRAAYHDPWMMKGVDEVLYGMSPSTLTRKAVVESMTAYLLQRYPDDTQAIRAVARHTMGIAMGLNGARRWRQVLSDPAAFKAYGPEILMKAWEDAFGENTY